MREQSVLSSQTPPPGGLKPETNSASYERDIVDHKNLDDLASFVGVTFQQSYEKRFLALQKNQDKYVLDWNWSAFLLPFPWLIYRKMFLYAVAYFVVCFFFVFWSTATAGVLVVSTANIILGLFGTRIYYHVANQRIAKITGLGKERDQKLVTTGGVVSIPVVGVVSLVFVFLSSMVVYSVFIVPKGSLATNAANKDLANLHDSVDKASALKIVRAKHAINMSISLKWQASGEKRLPSAVTDLKKEYELPVDLFMDSWGSEIEYQPTRRGFKLRSAGPDKEFATEDDIFVSSVLDK